MNNDLISREALKERIQLAPNKNEETWEELYDSIIYEIDNAPTVEGEILTKEAYSDLCLRASIERPQGEWVENLMHSTICSNCGGIRRDNRVDYIAFCNKCGADMKGGAE